MNVFVTGATGFVGSAVVRALHAAGHHVTGLARSGQIGAGARIDRRTRASRFAGRCRQPEARRCAGGRRHPHRVHSRLLEHGRCIGDRQARDRSDRRGARGIRVGRSSSPRRLGCSRRARSAKNRTRPIPNAAGAHRLASERTALSLAERGVRASVVRLPFSVHGEGDYGFVPALVRIAREKKVSAYIGDGQNRWTAVHRLDAAQLFRLALEKGAAGATYHAIGDEGVLTRDIALMIGQGLEVPVVPRTREEAAGPLRVAREVLCER